MDGLLMESSDEPNVPLVEWNRVEIPESKNKRILSVVIMWKGSKDFGKQDDYI